MGESHWYHWLSGIRQQRRFGHYLPNGINPLLQFLVFISELFDKMERHMKTIRNEVHQAFKQQLKKWEPRED
jgi:hypothetical protein